MSRSVGSNPTASLYVLPRSIMKSVLLLAMASLTMAFTPPKYCPHPARSTTQVKKFEKQTGYPTGRPGYIVDHKTPLCACGLDAPSNMQWQTKAAAAKKDIKEKQLCAQLRKATPK
jgi:hypothetical protein